MSRKTRFVVFAILLSVCIVGMLSADRISTTQASTVKPAATQTIEITNFAFTPSTLTIPVGTTVTWTNKAPINHTTTSDDGTTWDSDVISPNGSFSFQFTQPGTYTYHCNIHLNMRGTIIVQ